MPARDRLTIVANRLPVERVRRGGETRWQRSPGGLVSALAPLVEAREGRWVGWAGTAGKSPEPFRDGAIHLEPVELSRSDIEHFYAGFSNGTLWPLYHDAVRWPEFHRHWWRTYRDVNRRFAEAAARVTNGDSLVWVHDYQLQLVPSYLRELSPELRIGFFLHIPFPPVELFAQIPWRSLLLEGLLGADLVGFQTKLGAQNFAHAARRYAGATGTGSKLQYRGRTVEVGCFPISIDRAKYAELAATSKVQTRAKRIRQQVGDGRKILLGVDRLDYTKGIDRRLKAFEEWLERAPENRELATFVQVAVPSREAVPDYAEMRLQIEGQVGHINGSHGEAGRAPVHYLYRNLPQDELVAWYVAADVMVVTPLRDGMNLVAKEFVSSRANLDGVLVLSEFTGAAHELTEALLVNPHDVDGLADALQTALDMPEAEQRRRMTAMRRTVEQHDVHHWANQFLEALQR